MRFCERALDDVARGIAWEAIIEQSRGSISKDAIAEAVRLTREARLNHVDELADEPVGQ
jgi:hypothetical protein